MLSVNGLQQVMLSANYGKSDPLEALNLWWDSICNYIKSNASIVYSWSGQFNGVSDPVVSFSGHFIGSNGSLSLSYAVTPETALQSISSQMNSILGSWSVQFEDSSFRAIALLLPSIDLVISNKSERAQAHLSIAGDILRGIRDCTLSTLGAHGNFTGSASFVSVS